MKGRVVGAALGATLVAAVILVSTDDVAADGDPDIGLTVSMASETLYGAPTSVTLTATNSTGTDGYNLSFNDVLPADVTIQNSDPAPTRNFLDGSGNRVLIWENVADLQAGTTVSVSYEFVATNPAYVVGDTVGDSAGAYVNNCDFFDMPLAEEARVEFRAFADAGLVQSTLAYHWARMIELLYCAEKIKDLLNDPDILGSELKIEGEKRNKGIGVIEAPRGTLFHHYEVDDDGLVTRANLIVSTTNNNQAMNESIRKVSANELAGQELTEPMLNQIEIAIRAYDPCLSCATHALGKMPLEVELVDTQGNILDRKYKNANGDINACEIEA